MAEGEFQEPGAQQDLSGVSASLQDGIGDAAQGAPQASRTAPAMREDQIQNAVSFLSHPKVRDSPAASKVSFLEKKGLTQAEIDEAFRRVPDAPTASVPAGSSGLPVQAAPGAPHKPFPTGTAATLQQLQPVPVAPPPQPIRWTQVVVGLGLVTALGYAVKQYAVPKVIEWYREWRSDSDKVAAEQEAQKTAQLVASAIQAQTAEMQKTLGELKEAIGTLEKGKAAAVEAPPDTVTLAQLRSELRVLATSLNEFGSPAKSSTDAEESRKLDEIKTMVATVAGQLSARPVPISPMQDPLYSPDVYPRANGTEENYKPPRLDEGVPDIGTVEPLPQPPHPASYMEVLEMLEKGQTPPGIREDIVDTPPNPAAPPPGARMKPRPKPWERAGPEPHSTAAAVNGTVFPAGVPRAPSAGAFPPAARVAAAQSDGEHSPPRAPWADGGPSYAAQAVKPTAEAAGQGYSPEAARASSSSSTSSPAVADVWKPPAVPQPSIPRPPPAARPVSPTASAASLDGAGAVSGAASAAPAEPAPDQAEAIEQQTT